MAISSGKYPIRWNFVLVVTLIVAALFIWESRHLRIETDILESMPHKDPVLADAREVIEHLPIQNQVFINLEQNFPDRDRLVAQAALVSEKLAQSGLFTRVGVGDDAKNFPELMIQVSNNLPYLLSAEDLELKIKPLLTPERIRETMEQNRHALEQLDAIGRGPMIARDPLGFSGVVFRQMTSLFPANKAQFYQGQLLSEDGRNVLIIAQTKGSGTDTVVAGKIEKLVEECHRRLDSENRYSLTAVGAYRVALDNETAARHDGQWAIILTTLGIALLLLIAFPRPLIGLLALLPSSVGAIAALWVCSFIFDSMSVLAVGFGGAIMAFTVDMGITYLLFLDRQQETYGEKAAREVRSAEFLAALTTVGAFLLLLISDFKILVQIGTFSALGVTFAFLFVHYVFPKIFPVLPPAKKTSNPLLSKAIQTIAAPAKWKLIFAAAFFAVMLLFARPVFHVDINAMNYMSPETIQADKKIRGLWGNLSGRSYLLLEAPDRMQLQQKNDRLRKILDEDVRQEKLSAFFLPTVLFPSPQKAQENFTAWRAFWTQERLTLLKRDLDSAAKHYGFAPRAFEPFWQIIRQQTPRVFDIPEKYFDMLGIAKSPTGYTQISLVVSGKNYDAADLSTRLSRSGLAKLFDADLFSKKLGDFLKKLFLEIAWITGIGLVLVIFLYFMDWKLSLATLTPVTFALVATLGTLKLIGHPLDIPCIMLWIVIMGMGIDYQAYYICTYQRLPDGSSPAMQTIKLAIFSSAATSLIGFGVLALAKHPLLQSIGMVSFLGIGYSLMGTYFILPVVVERIFSPASSPAGKFSAGSQEHLERTALRYRHLPAYPRIFSRMKMMIDPMFKELDQYVVHPRRMMDIGCGYGVPAAWLLELYPQAQIYGIEPDEERVLIAAHVIGHRGFVEAGRAPDLPRVEGLVDYVLMLDMLHLIDDPEVQIVFRRIYEKLEEGGTLLIRATIPSPKTVPWKRWMEEMRLRIAGRGHRFRPEDDIVNFMKEAGFAVEVFASAPAGIEEKWFVGKKK